MTRVSAARKATSTWDLGFVAAPTLEQVRSGAARLKPGHQGPAVLALKQIFNQLGRSNPRYVPLVENDRFDRELLHKVARFQTNNPELYDRRSHGTVDGETLAALEARRSGAPVTDAATAAAPSPDAAATPGFFYEVRAGDSLDRIARHFKLGSYLDLLGDDRNAGLRKNPHDLAVGQKVFVPVAGPISDLAAEPGDTYVHPPKDATGLVIRPGEPSPYVDALRTALRKLGYKGPLPTGCGQYDNATEVGVRWYKANFDSYRGAVDGVVNERVWNGLRAELGVAADKPPTDLISAVPTVSAKLPEPLEPGVRVRVKPLANPVSTPPGPPAPPGAQPVSNTTAAAGPEVMELPPLRRNISRGKVGLDVEVAQRVLNRLGATPPLDVDASAGTKLQTAAIAYQRSRNLEDASGVIGPETWAKFAEELATAQPLRADIRVEVGAQSLTSEVQRNALGTLQVLAAEDPGRLRRLAGYAGTTAQSPLEIDLALVDAVVGLGVSAGMPLEERGAAGVVAYESARTLMDFLDAVVKNGKVSTTKFDRTTWDAKIVAAARRHGIDPALVKAVMKSESDFCQTVKGQTLTSAAGALGLMQLMPDTAAGLGVDPYDATQNIEGGAKYLAQLWRRFDGDLSKVVAAYNAGPGAVEKYDGVPPYRETMGYVRKVTAAYQHYQATGQPAG